MPKFQLSWSWRIFAAFCLLNYLLGAGHELSHHVVGFISSGRLGRISFGLFASPAADPRPILTSLAGPIFTLAVAWIGATLLLHGEHPVIAYALVACSHSFMRLVAVVGRGGDESVSARTLFGYLPYWQLVAVEAVVVGPPLIIAWRALANHNRSAIFLASVVGSFLPLVLLKVIDDHWFVPFVHDPGSFHHPVLLGMPIVVLLAHCIALLIFVTLGWRVFSPHRP